MSAASQARRRQAADDLEIVAFERGSFTSYSACGIPYFVGGTVKDVSALVVRTPDAFRNDHLIDARIRHEAVELDVARGAVCVLELESGGRHWEPYDELLLATGSRPIRPSLPGADARGIFGIQTLDDGLALHRTMADNPRRAVVVGGGYIGLELAEAFRARDMTVRLLEKADQVMPSLDRDMAVLVADALREFGVDLHTEEPVVGFETSDGRVRAVSTEAASYAADVVVLGLGVAPDAALARGAGIALGDAGGVRVDRRMRTSVDGVWSAGDCAEKWHRVARRWTTIPLGTHANKEGRVAGINIGGGYATFPGVVGTAVSKICEVEVARTGLNEAEARAAGFETVSVTIDSTTRAGYFPEAAPLKTKMVAEKLSGRLLGAQIVGREGAAKRIDVAAVAVWNQMTVDEVLNLDLSYAPPFSPVWDPVAMAARRAAPLVFDDAS
jgi:NADPH-dependent 2,4-dienoyl-CoA reductase/sulfur reductase-like enzyme